MPQNNGFTVCERVGKTVDVRPSCLSRDKYWALPRSTGDLASRTRFPTPGSRFTMHSFQNIPEGSLIALSVVQERGWLWGTTGIALDSNRPQRGHRAPSLLLFDPVVQSYFTVTEFRVLWPNTHFRSYRAEAATAIGDLNKTLGDTSLPGPKLEDLMPA